MLLLRCLGKFFEVSDQVLELWHLDELLNYVARVEMANRLYVLSNCFVVLLHLVELVSVVLRNFSDNVRWEFGLIRDVLCIDEKTFFQ